MSLSDALLLDPFRDPREIWIALRTDGARGSGVQSDPYDGSTIYSAPISITSLTTPDPTNNPLVAQATTSSAHGLVDYDVVIISGAGANGDWYDGWFLAYDTDIDGPNKFKYKMRFKAAATSATGRVMQEPLAYRFDEVMAGLGEKTAVHLAPGVFQSRGHSGADASTYGWRLQSGLRILGAGMGLTTLKIVGGAVRNRQYAAFYANTHMEGLEISNLTVDCNLEDQPEADLLCAAVSLVGGGRHVRVRRVRAINWGTRFPDEYRENFVFFLASRAGVGDAIDCAFEECVAEQPSPNNHWNSTIFAMGGNGEEEWRGKKGSNYACAVRDCYVDARNDYGPVVPIASISRNSGIVTVETRGPHGHHKPGNLIVQGVSNNAFNGIFEIDSIEDDTTLKYKLTGDPITSSGGTIGGRVSSNDITLDGVATTSNNKQFKLTTRGSHFRTRNNTITVKGITDNGTVVAALNGTFPIVEPYDPTKPDELTYQINQEYVPVGTLSTIRAIAKTGHLALTADNGISEGNRVFHCGAGGPYRDTWSARTVVARENYYQDVLSGPSMFLDRVSTWAWGNGTYGRLRLKSLDYDDSELICPTLALHSFAEYENSIAIAKVPPPSDPADDPTNPDPHLAISSVRRHSLLANDTVRIAAAGADGALYTGTFKVIETPDAQTFTFEANGTVTVPGSAPVFLPRIKNSYEDLLPDHQRAFYDLRPLESVTSSSLGGTKYKVTATVRDLPVNVNGQIVHHDQHKLEKGEFVKVGNVGTHPARSSVLNGNFKITGVSADGKSFDFEVESATPPGNPADAGFYGRIWRCDYWLFENNVVETAIRHLWEQAPDSRDSGLTLSVGNHPPHYVLLQAVIRDNLFRHVNNGSDPNKNVAGYPLPRAMQFWEAPFSAGYGTEDGLVQRNIIRLDSVAKILAGVPPTPIEFQPSFDAQRGVHTFNNISPDGILISAASEPQFPFEIRPDLSSEIQTKIEEAICASFLV